MNAAQRRGLQRKARAQWVSIVMAPRDGTELLLTTIHRNPEDGHGETDFGFWGVIEEDDYTGQDVYGWLSNYGRIEEPTHFMYPPRSLP